MGEARLPPLEDLALPDGTPVEAVYRADRNRPPLQQRKLLGRLIDGQIALVEGAEAGAAERRVDARGFLAAAGYGARFINPYQRIRLPQQGITLAQHAGGAAGGATQEQQRIAALLEREYRVNSLGELWQYVEAHPIRGKVYRVCRLDEIDIDKRGLTSNGGLRPWWRQAGAAPAPASRFVQDVDNHIRNGSRANRQRQPLISATRDLHTALSWGYGGCHPIVAIDVAAAAAKCVRAFDMGGSLNNLCSQVVCHFAASSAEVVFDGDIPAHCVTLLEAKWDPLGDCLLSSPNTAHLFPRELCKQQVKVIRELEEGNSKPLQVEVPLSRERNRRLTAPTNTEPERRQYVLKRGGGAGGTSRTAHIVSEFAAMAMYARAGLEVPRAALYTVKASVICSHSQHCLSSCLALCLAAAAAGMETAPTACSIESLPDGLLGHIMLLVDAEHRRSLSLVSRRWREVYLNEPGLWRSYTVCTDRVSEAPAEWAQRLEQRVAVLQRVARHVVTFYWDEFTDVLEPPADVVLERCLSALRSGQLAELQLSGPCPSAGLAPASAALAELSSATSLTLAVCLAGPAAAALSALSSHLRSLQLNFHSLAPAFLERIVQAAQLTALSIESYAWPALGALTLLSQLKQLALLDLRADFQDSMQPPPPSSFPAGLERYSYESKYRSFVLAGCDLSKLRLWQGKAPAFGFAEGAAYDPPLATLAIGCRTRSLPLAQLLSKLQPAGQQPQPFQQLELCGALPDAAAVAGWEQLSDLRELSLTGLRPRLTAACEQCVAALLHNASRLSALSITGVPHAALGVIPLGLASYCGLSSLSLVGQGLTNLPAGDYLADLQDLDLSHNLFVRMPAALSRATALTHLSLNGNCGLSLCNDDAAVLLALPHLRLLEVSRIKAAEPALLNELQLRMPHLRVVGLTPNAAA